MIFIAWLIYSWLNFDNKYTDNHHDQCRHRYRVQVYRNCSSGKQAKNPFIAQLLTQETKRKILIPKNPEMNGAIGTALLAWENERK